MDLIKAVVKNLKNAFEKKGQKKLVENLVIILIIAAIALIGMNSLFEKPKSATKQEVTETQLIKKDLNLSEKTDEESRIKDVLSQIDGAGKVDIMVTYISGKEIIPAFDVKKNESDTSEKDTGGGTRAIKQDDKESKLVYEDIGGGIKKPIIVKEINPSVKGVIVVADGAENITVKENLIKAIQVLMDVPVYKIQVFSRSGK